MGDLTVLGERRAQRSRRPCSPPAPAVATGDFYFDPCCPFSYLASERVERQFSSVAWIPVSAAALDSGQPWSDPRVARLLRVLAQRRASELRLPLVWPERFPPLGAAALRVAVHAVAVGAGPAFALAAGRLAFCGGFDLDDPHSLAEAAAAAGIEHDECLRAIAEPANDIPLQANARVLAGAGVTELPALRIGPRWFAGEASVTQASAWARARAPMAAPDPA